MKASTWRARIKSACIDVGTYRPSFDYIIDTLASILEKRDEAYKTYTALGGQPIVKYTNKGGATNSVANPALTLWDDLNKSALAYWRDLGLTPAGLKKIDEKAMQPKKRSTLAEVISSLG